MLYTSTTDPEDSSITCEVSVPLVFLLFWYNITNINVAYSLLLLMPSTHIFVQWSFRMFIRYDLVANLGFSCMISGRVVWWEKVLLN